MSIHILRKIPFLSALSTRHLREMLKISQIRDYAVRQQIFSKDEFGNQMFIVISGRAKIFIRSAAKKSKTIAYFHPGDFFGEMALLGGKTRCASAQAVEDTRLLVIRRADFRRILLADPHLTYFLLCTVAERLRRANEEIESLLFRNILGRVSKTLYDLVVGAGRKGRGGCMLQDRYTHQELADMVGTTREPLTRALSTLRRANILDVRHGRYFIKDTHKLASLCPEPN
ncbi:MAG: Crp/Fnr family transcriptional regulator [Elusimicrobia bacterium]|nr:Crp/Fnr family transcriptional regulator [Elusimicrobiota bacterium]